MSRITPLPEDTALCGKCHNEPARWLVTGAPERPDMILALCEDCVQEYVVNKWWQE